MEHQTTEHKHITLGVICVWTFGILFLISGVSFIASGDIVSGIIVLLVSALLLPPAWQKIREKTKINLSSGVKFLIVIAALAASSATMNADASSTSSTTTTTSTTSNLTQEEPEVSEPLLELLNYSGSRSYGYITIEGEVKNISNEKMESIQAVVRTYDANGDFVTSSDALIDYDPILADQTSPFSVMVKDNPAIENYRVEFKKFWGGTIETKYPDGE